MVCTLCQRDKQYFDELAVAMSKKIDSYIAGLDRKIQSVKETCASDMDFTVSKKKKYNSLKNEIRMMSINTVIADKTSFMTMEPLLDGLVNYYTVYVKSYEDRVAAATNIRPDKIGDLVQIFDQEPLDFRCQKMLAELSEEKTRAEATKNGITANTTFYTFSPGLDIFGRLMKSSKVPIQNQYRHKPIDSTISDAMARSINKDEIQEKISLVLCPTCYEFYKRCALASQGAPK